jgi:type VI secretion system secreted protein VgrG
MADDNSSSSGTGSGSSSSSSSTQGYVEVTIDPDPGIPLYLHYMEGTEELGRPFEFHLALSSMKSDTSSPTTDLTSWLGATCKLSITKPGNTTRYFNAIIARAMYDGIVGGAYHYRLELRPWIWLLSRVQDCKIFQNMAVFDIITKVFRDAGFTNFQDNRQNQAGSETLEYCVQYNETSLAFVTRLMEKYGIYYFFTHDESGTHTLVFADDPSSHTALDKAISFVTGEQTTYATVEDHIWEWGCDYAVVSGKTTFNDYNFTTPSADLKSTSAQQTTPTHTYGNFEIYEYPGPYPDTGVGTKIADVRMQRMFAEGLTLQAVTNSRQMYTGCLFTLSEFPDTKQNREYLVIGIKYHLGEAAGVPTTDGSIADAFRCTFRCIPQSVPFQLHEITPAPLMHGPQTAKVVGASGDEITTDQYGRIKVKFPWDRSAAQDDTASCWIRVAQIWAGQSWGAIYIPRVGQEVVVDFLNGNPDRPLIIGSVYNASQTVPYTLPDNKTRSTIKSNSSTGGGGLNELRFEDKKGSEEVFFQAQKDYTKTVLNNETVTITNDTSTTVQQGNRSVTVSQGNNSLTVSQGNNSVTVSTGNDSLTVSSGNHSITVSAGSSTVNAGQSITLQVGSNSITISTSGITVSGSTISLSATGTMSLQGSMVQIN